MPETHVVSFSELDTARQCRFKWGIGYQHRWKPDREAPALEIGTLLHLVLKAHYERIRDAQRAGEDVDAEMLYAAVGELLYDRETGGQTEYQQKVEWMYKGYVDCYGVEPQWQILEVEKKYELWLPNANGRRSSFKIKGTVDLVVRDLEVGGLWIVDHKTMRNLPKGRETDLDDQFGLYPWMMRRPKMAGTKAERGYGLKKQELLPGGGFNIRGAIHNAIRKEGLKTRELEHDERFKRTITVRTDQEMDNMALEVLDTFKDVYRQARELEKLDKLPPRTPDPERCGWKCSFQEACLMSRKGLDIHMLLAETGYVQDFTRH